MIRAIEIRGRWTRPRLRPAPVGRRVAGYAPVQRVVSFIETMSYALVRQRPLSIIALYSIVWLRARQAAVSRTGFHTGLQSRRRISSDFRCHLIPRISVANEGNRRDLERDSPARGGKILEGPVTFRPSACKSFVSSNVEQKASRQLGERAYGLEMTIEPVVTFEDQDRSLAVT
jgi:hypothetical protein